MTEREYLAHIAPDGRQQSVINHLRGTAALSRRFGGAYGMADQAEILGLVHDIGKCSAEFQARLHGGRIVDHATAGALSCARANFSAIWAACCIAGHHGGLPDVGSFMTDQPGDPTLAGRLKRGNNGEIPSYDPPIVLNSVPNPPGYGSDYLADSYTIRMLYSCLVDADYLDTERFMKGVDREQRSDSISELCDRLDSYIQPWWNPTGELNKARCKVLKDCIDGANNPKGLYTLTVPTGGGKTIASMAYALHHAKLHGMDRVIYVIIEQNAAVFREIFGADNVLEHHSNMTVDIQSNDSTGKYAALSAVENWDAPIVVTTSVQFFESLYSNRPSRCRKLHNIANSVIIFDEAQMMPAENLRPCTAAISALVSRFGATAVLCTATQPVLNDLFAEYAPTLSVAELNPESAKPDEVFRRTTLKTIGRIDAESLADCLNKHRQVLCIVNDRRSARALFSRLTGDGNYHLSTLMYPRHRRRVLETIRHRLTDELPCRVVSTSLIEAGVDVDFPAVYRELAGLDSVLQAAGRCNREGKRSTEDSIVFIFEGISTPSCGMQVNIGASREALSGGADAADPETMTRYFQAYRSLAGDRLDKYDVIHKQKAGIAGCLLPFKTVSESFKMIDNCTKTVYIPCEEGEKLVRRYESGERSRSLSRALGQYAVSIYDYQYEALLASGRIKALDEDNGALVSAEGYDGRVGLLLPDTGEGLYI